MLCYSCFLISNKQTLLDGSLFESPKGLVAFKGIVFWADLGDKAVHWYNASNPGETGKVIEDRKYLRRITLFRRESPKTRCLRKCCILVRDKHS